MLRTTGRPATRWFRGVPMRPPSSLTSTFTARAARNVEEVRLTARACWRSLKLGTCGQAERDFRPYVEIIEQEHRSRMFAAHRVSIDTAYQVVVVRLSQFMNWGALDGVSEAAYERSLETTLRVGPFGSTRGLSRLVRVNTLEPVSHDGKTTVSLRWEATGTTGDMFPVLDAELTVTPDGAERSHVELVGSYRPPLGRAGAALDRAIMAHVAEATIRSFLERVAAVLANPAESRARPEAAQNWRLQTNPEEP